MQTIIPEMCVIAPAVSILRKFFLYFYMHRNKPHYYLQVQYFTFSSLDINKFCLAYLGMIWIFIMLSTVFNKLQLAYLTS